ncbi:MAG: hypothetical protein ACYS76_00065 [Planctomycetota bacterium]|jgi:hypothetical protein
MNSLKLKLLSLLPVFLSGCQFYTTAPAPVVDYYYLNPHKNLALIGKVAIVELDNHSSYPEVSSDVTKGLYEALQKKQIFSLTIVRQNDPAWRSLQLELGSTYSLEQLAAIRGALKCDAVLIGTVTEFKPYPHMTMGLRLKLIDLKDGQLLWALEQVWDTADKLTERRIKKYFRSQIRSGFDPLRERLAVVSPISFIRFVAYEVGETLR